MVLVPNPTVPPRMIIFLHCGLHSPMRSRSEITDQTCSGVASISMDSSMSAAVMVANSMGLLAYRQ